MARSMREADGESVVRAIGMVVLGGSMVAAAVAARRARRRAKNRGAFLQHRVTRPVADAGRPSGQTRELRSAAALLALSVFADSAVEHFRGSYRNRGMYAPVGMSALVAAANLRGLGERRSNSPARDVLHRTAFVLGLGGMGFHASNVLRRPAGLCWQNLFYAAPVGAPAALALSGVLGLAADHLRVPRSRRSTLAGLPAGRALAALAVIGLAGSTAEAGLLHFRGSFQNRFMWLPVTVPPVAAVMLAAGAVRPERRRLALARGWLRLTAALGLGGAILHARGIARMMGGWRNWSQNVVDGPPLPAPPSFTAFAMAGGAALTLIERDHG